MNKRDFKIVFLGHDFGLILKEKLEKAGFHIVNPASRKMDLVVVGFYGKILSREILETPEYGALNVHPSLLPKYRGPTPVQTAILNGETKTGVTIIHMDEKMDHGPILASQKFLISNFKFLNGLGKPTTPELTKELWEIGGDLLVKTIPKWVAGEIKAKEQDHKSATYTKILTRKDGRIDWSKTAEAIERQVRAFTPWPGSFFMWRNKKIEIIDAEIKESSKAGTVHASQKQGLSPLCKAKKLGEVFRAESGNMAVQTSKNALELKIIKPESKNEMGSKQFLNGYLEILGSIIT